MPSEIWRLLPSPILTPCKNLLILILIDSMYHFKPLTTRLTLTNPCSPIEFLLLLPVLPCFSNHTTYLPEHNRTHIVPILRLLLQLAVQHVARILSDHVCHLHDADQGGERAILVDVGALAQPHDVFVLGVVEGGWVYVQEPIRVCQSRVCDECRGFARRVDQEVSVGLGGSIVKCHDLVLVV